VQARPMAGVSYAASFRRINEVCAKEYRPENNMMSASSDPISEELLARTDHVSSRCPLARFSPRTSFQLSPNA
jgi:hypothetical protein